MKLPARITAACARARSLAPALPGGTRLWVTLASAGFLLAALLGHGRQLLQQSLDGQGWCWLLLGVGLSLLSLLANGAAWGVVLRWLGQRPRWQATVSLFLSSNLRKYLPGGIWHLASRLQALRRPEPSDPLAPLAQPLSTPQALVAVLLDPLLDNNPIGLQVLGICSALAVTTKIDRKSTRLNSSHSSVSRMPSSA